MTLRTGEDTVIWRRKLRSHCVEASFWRRLWTYRQTEYWMKWMNDELLLLNHYLLLPIGYLVSGVFLQPQEVYDEVFNFIFWSKLKCTIEQGICVYDSVLKRSWWGISAKVAERYPDRSLPCIATVYENICKFQPQDQCWVEEQGVLSSNLTPAFLNWFLAQQICHCCCGYVYSLWRAFRLNKHSGPKFGIQFFCHDRIIY